MATQPSVILTYIRLLFIPMNQSIDYDFLVVHTFADPRFIIPAIIILLTLILAIAIRKKFPYISFGILFFFLTLSIESSIIPIPDMIVEHRLYLPSVGFFLACIAGILQLLQTKNMTALSKYAFPILIGLCMALTFQRNTVWQSELSLWQDASTKSPQKIRPHLAYAISLKNAHQPDQSLQEFLYTHSLLTTKNLPKEQKNAWYLVINQHLAEMYAQKKEYKEAIRYQQEMITIDPTDGWLYENLGMLHAQNNDLTSAHEAFAKAISLSPTASAYYNDGVILTHLQRYQEARTAYTKALELKPDLFQAKQNLDRLP